MRSAFGVPVGLSDHSEGIAVPTAAAALGADLIEKHFTLNRELPGPDHPFALEPDQLRTLVASVREVEAALGNGRLEGPSDVEAGEMYTLARRSIAACNVATTRPTGGRARAALTCWRSRRSWIRPCARFRQNLATLGSSGDGVIAQATSPTWPSTG